MYSVRRCIFADVAGEVSMLIGKERPLLFPRIHIDPKYNPQIVAVRVNKFSIIIWLHGRNGTQHFVVVLVKSQGLGCDNCRRDM